MLQELDICGNSLRLPEDNTTSASPGPAVFVCSECGDCLSSQDCLNEHMLDSHAQKLQRKWDCSYCSYTTNRRDHLTKHEYIHTGARPLSCPSCNKTFTQKGNLVRHQRVHTGERPYKCTVCGQQFKDSSALSKHRTLHLDGGKPHKCHYCGAAFKHERNMIAHLEIHTRERQHACRWCDKKFNQSSSARKHEQQMHSSETSPINSSSHGGSNEKLNS